MWLLWILSLTIVRFDKTFMLSSIWWRCERI